MKKPRNINYSRLTTLALVYSAVLPISQAITPPPDGGYPGRNTAEGQNALLSLSDGSAVKATEATSSLPTTPCAAILAYVSNFFDVVTVIDTSSNRIVTTVNTGFEPFGVAVKPDGTRVYVANNGDNTVSVIDTSNNTVVATVAVGTSPLGVAVKADGSRAYVTNRGNNSVSVIDTFNNTVVATVVVPSPYGVAVNPDGTRAYVSDHDAGTFSVIDTSTNAVTATVMVGTSPQGVAVRPDGTRAYVANTGSSTIAVINTSNNTVVDTIPVGSFPDGVAVKPDGTRVYVVNNMGNTVSVIDTSNNTVVATVPVGTAPNGVAVTPDGTRVYVANYLDNTVSVIDTNNNTVIDTVSPVDSPVGFGDFIATVPCGSPTATPTATPTPTPTATPSPAVTTKPATNVASVSATLNGSVNPRGSTTTVYFQWGTTTTYGHTTAIQTKTGNTSLPITANISGLSASQLYHFRIVATNGGGTSFGTDRTFTTLAATGPPVVTTNQASNVTTSAASPKGSLDPHALTTSVHFQYGTTTSYGHATAMVTQTGNTYRNIAANISGLAMHATYHFRILATNSGGTRVSSDRTLTTP